MKEHEDPLQDHHYNVLYIVCRNIHTCKLTIIQLTRFSLMVTLHLVQLHVICKEKKGLRIIRIECTVDLQ